MRTHERRPMSEIVRLIPGSGALEHSGWHILWKSDMTQWYETLFANFGKTYDKESFTQGTVGEVDFVERELGGRSVQANPGHRLRHGPPRHRACQARLPRDRLRSLRGPASPRPRKSGRGRRCRRVSTSRRDSAALQPGIRRGHHVLRRRVSVDGDRREELRHSHARRRGVASRRQIAPDDAQCPVPAVSLGQGFS